MAKWTDGWLRPRDYNLYVFISIQTDAFVYSLLVTVDLMQYTPKFIARLNWAPKNGNANNSCAYARVIREIFYWKYISNKKLNIEIILSIPNMHNEKKTRKNETSSKSLLHFCAFFKFKVCCCVYVYVHLYSHFHSHALNHRRTQCQFLQQLLTIRF